MLRQIEGSTITAWRPGPATVRRAVEVVLVVLLAGQSARLVWAAVTPVGPLGEPVSARTAAMSLPIDTSVLERFRPAAPELAMALADPGLATVVSAPATVALSLHGVRASMFGDGGTAIIGTPDGKQAAYRPGETIAPGVRLSRIGRDFAVVTQNGAPVRLAFGANAAPAAPPPSVAAPAVAAGGPSAVATSEAGGSLPTTTPIIVPQPQAPPAPASQIGRTFDPSGRQPGLAQALVGARSTAAVVDQNGQIQTLNTRPGR